MRQNLVLHAQLFDLPKAESEPRIEELIERFDLGVVAAQQSGELPLGLRQRLSLAVAVLHRPEVLILGEPTSGVDLAARDDFWRLLIELFREQGVTIFLSTHFMNEAQRCDRISLMHAGKVLACDTPMRCNNSSRVTRWKPLSLPALSRHKTIRGPALNLRQSLAPRRSSKHRRRSVKEALA